MNRLKLRMRLTASGKMLLFLAVFLLFAAQNTGNNLLYLMSSCFLACLLWAGTSSLRNLSGLKIELQFPEFCFAGQENTLRCRVEDLVGRSRFYLGFEDDFVPRLAANEMVILKTSFSVPRRGKYLVKEFKLFSCYPVDLFLTCIEAPVDALMVGPEPSRNIPEIFARNVGGVLQRQVSGKEGDYWMQKHYQDGDDASMINWGISAHSFYEWVLIKSVDFGANRKICFDFSGLDRDLFESSLRVVAGLLVKLRNGGADVLIWADASQRGYSWLSINHDMSGIVRWLACLEPSDPQALMESAVEPIKLSQVVGIEL